MRNGRAKPTELNMSNGNQSRVAAEEEKNNFKFKNCPKSQI